MTSQSATEASDPEAARVLRFWFGEGAQYANRRRAWFEKDAGFDGQVAQQFLALYEEAAAGLRDRWHRVPADCLALVVVLDQFPRNLFRATPRAFATDGRALLMAQHAVENGYDFAMLPGERLFLYLPFEHAESLPMQQRSCELMRPLAAFPETHDAYRYAIAHREIIERFGRFPHRNALLGRDSTPEEAEFLKRPGSSF